MEYNDEIKRKQNLEKRNSGKINCTKCKYFKITWNPKFPRSCLIFGFKGKDFPSKSVLEATGKECPSFEKKLAH